MAPGLRLILTRLAFGPTADRNEWIRTLQQIAEEQKGKAAVRTSMSLATDSATELADKSGFLELRGFKHKLFVVVAGDKVFLYKNAEVGGWGGCGTMGNPDAPSLCTASLSRAAVSQGTQACHHPSHRSSTEATGCCPLSPPSLLALSLGISQEHDTHCSCFQSLWCPRFTPDESWAVKGQSYPSSQALDPIIHSPLIPCPPSPTRTIGWGLASPTLR